MFCIQKYITIIQKAVWLLRVSLGLHALLFLVAKIVVLYSLYYTAPSHTPTACFSTARFNIEFIARVPQIMYTKHCFPLKIELHA